MSDYLFDKSSGAGAPSSSEPGDARDLREVATGTPTAPDDVAATDAADVASIQELEQLLGGYAHRAPLGELPPQRPRAHVVRRVVAPAAFALAAIAAALLLWFRAEVSVVCTGGGPGFAFAVAGGPARCAGDATARGTLPVGAWLETPTASVAEIKLASIGELTVYGDSRVRLVGTSPREHRMELARGKVSARVIAPPRLFVVDTPFATAVDLGCAYELSVDDAGRTHLVVTSGAVSLEGNGRVSYAPAGTEVIATPGHGPGTPFSIRSSPAFREALARFDTGEPTALGELLAAAGPDDTITLWNLLPRTRDLARGSVAARLEALRGRPATVTPESILSGDPDAFERWRDDLELDWGGNVRKLKSHR